MNKKKILYYVSIILFMILVGVTISIITLSKGDKYETEEVKSLKDVLVALDEGRKSEKRGYEISFIQNLDYVEKDNNSLESYDYEAHYESSGNLKLTYENKSIKKVDFEDIYEGIFKNNDGFIYGNQKEKYVIENKETDKTSNESLKEENINYSVENEFLLDSNNDNLSVFSKTNYENKIDSNKNSNDSFTGKISKNVLNETIELDRIDRAMNEVMFVSTWDTVNSLINLVSDSFSSLDYNNYKEIYNYIENKGYKYERKDNLIIIDFMLDLDASLNDNIKNNFDNVYFHLEVDTKTKEINNFKFDLSRYFTSILKSDSDSNQITANVNTYIIEGKIINNKLNNIDKTNMQFIEYNDETKYDFIDGFTEHAIPLKEEIF